MLCGEISDLTLEGVGVTRVDGKVYFVEGGLPGETVEFEVTQDQRRFSKAQMHNVVGAASEHRIESDCSYFDQCGGCSLRHFDQAAQLESKQKALLEILQRIGHCQPLEIMPLIDSERLHYRRKTRLAVAYNADTEELKLGFKAKHNQNVISISSCKILNHDIDQLLIPLKLLLSGLATKQHIKEIEIAQAQNQIGMLFKSQQDLSKPESELIEAFAQEHNLQIYLSIKSRRKIIRIWPAQPSPLYYSLDEFKLKFNFSVSDFIQVNEKVNQSLVTKVVELLAPKKDEKILDLFCGLGNFSLPLALNCRHLLGVEGDKELVEKARANAVLNKIENAQFRFQNLAQSDADYIWLKHGFEKVLIDPARAGAQTIIDKLGQVKPNRIVYVSCNPATLARDADTLVNKYGYQLTQLGLVNMFPDTSHLESIAVFE